MSEEELKPCPFCGSTNIRKNFGIFPELFCSECEATIYAYDNYEDLDKSWNTRPLEDALQARIAELEERLRLVPISEQKPEFINSVIFVNDIHTWIGWRYDDDDYDTFDKRIGYHEKPTHWMPLPNLPEVKDE